MSEEAKYRKLPGRSGLLIRHSLWMKPDHLLRVRANPFSETYRRYYFSDIQAVVLAELPRQLEFAGYLISALIAVLTVGLFYTAHSVWGTLSALGAAAVLLWSASRPDCTCYLRTRVATDPVAALGRLRNARETLAILKEEIEKAQGAIGRETIEAFPFDSQPSLPDTVPPLRHSGTRLHWALFALVLVRAGAAAALVAWGKYSMFGGMLADGIGAIVLLTGVVAAFQQHGTDLAKGIRWMVYAALAWYFLGMAAGFGVNLFASIQLGPKGTASGVWGHPMVRAYQLANIAGFLLIGCTGLVLLWGRGRSEPVPPPLSPADEGPGAA